MAGSRPESPIHAKNFHTINRPSSAQITPPIVSQQIKPTIIPSQFRPASAHVPINRMPTSAHEPRSDLISRPILKPVTSPLAKEVPLAPKWPQQTPERQFSFSVSTRSSSESCFGKQLLSPPVNSPTSQMADNLSTWLGRGKPKRATNGNESPSEIIAGMSQVYHNPTPDPSDSQVVICFKCKKAISGKFFTAMSQHWHPECFKCSMNDCNQRLDLHGYIEENGSPFCKKCYEDEMAYSCSKCGLKIIGDIMHALNQTWHVKCFCCCICGTPFPDGIFHFVGEQPYCQSCAPGGPIAKDCVNDSDSLDDSCSLLTSDSFNLDGIQSVAGDRPVSMMSYQSSIMPRYQMDPARLGSSSRLHAERRKPTKDEDLRIQSLKNRWAKINAISQDYEKTPSLSKRYMNTK